MAAVGRSKRRDPALAIGYIRASTREQTLTPVAQRTAMEAWCKANAVQLVEVYDDLGVSGGAEIEKRAGLLEALAELSSIGAGVFIVAKRDRLARDTLQAAMAQRLVERQGAVVVSADGSGNGAGPEAELFRTILDAFAAYERAVIRSRTRAALRVKRERGERVGTVPFGFESRGGNLVPCADEQHVISAISELRSEGLSLRAIVRELEAGSYPCRGNRWHLTTVARILRRTDCTVPEPAA